MTQRAGSLLPALQTPRLSEYDPASVGLPAEFHLTAFARRKGCGCKIPQDELMDLLRDAGVLTATSTTMDTSVIPLETPAGFSLVATTDFFFPLVDDPYTQGRIACSNVLSDLYAQGVVECHNLLMCLASALDMPDSVRGRVTTELVRGFHDQARRANTRVTGGQSIVNPWAIIGGVAQSVVPSERVLLPHSASAGDVLLLTKPLGTQLAVNLHQWLHTDAQWSAVSHVISREDAHWAYDMAAQSMERLNRTAAALMWKHGVHASTDVTGFGILGHAKNLASNQREAVSLEIDALPVLAGMAAVDDAVDGRFRLRQGLSAETSGGLLICLSAADAERYRKELEQTEHWPVFTVG